MPIGGKAKSAHGAVRAGMDTPGKVREAAKAFVKSASNIRKGAIALFGAADVLLSYTSPSQIAKWWTGYDVVMKEQKANTEKVKRETLNAIAEKIFKRRDERKIVWGR